MLETYIPSGWDWRWRWNGWLVLVWAHDDDDRHH